jgi:hypothetical protein
MNPSSFFLRCPRRAFAAALVLLAGAISLRAVVFENGDLKGSFDTTLSVGMLIRVDNPDPALYGLTNSFNGVPGQQYSVNADDGNLNYRRGLASFLIKADSELELDYHDSGLFVRGYVFNDFVNSNGQRLKVPLTDEADRLVSQGGELLDAYVYYKPTLGSMPARFSIGQQVLSWGESTFIPNGINSINPIDVARLRSPGSELKEALLPVNMAAGSINLTADLSLEAFYLLDWKRTRIDPPGTLFSTNDFVAPGGKRVYLGFGAIPDTFPLGYIGRGDDREPKNSNQYGVNLKYLAHGLGETEFGIYYLNYHSRLPFVSAITPSAPINPAPVIAAAGAAAQVTIVPDMLAAGFPPASIPAALTPLLGAALKGYPASVLPPSLQPFYPDAQAIAASPAIQGLRRQAFLTAAATGQYVVDFPDDIHLFGASFNTSVKGIAVQGEITYRDNQPLQVDDVELLFAALSAMDDRTSLSSPQYGLNNQLGDYKGQFGTYVPGYRREKVWTGQMTATWAGRGILGAQQTTVVGEVGFVNANLPSKDTLRFDAPGTYRSGSQTAMTNTGNGAAGADPASAFADKFSWGYQVVGRLDYPNLFAGINTAPLLAFAQDVSGNTPLPLGNFVEGRKTITVGADFTFQNAWAFELRYVNFFGAGRFNLLSDRDYVSATVKYSF